MPTTAARTTLECNDETWPATSFKLEVVMDTQTEVPDAARERLLRDMLERAAHHATFEFMPLEEGESSPGELESVAEAWRVPDHLHMKSVKSAHRFLTTAAALLERGPAPTIAEIGQRARLTLPPMYRYINPDDPTGAYLEPLLSVSRVGNAKVVDLTPLGRKVASRVRAGTLPT